MRKKELDTEATFDEIYTKNQNAYGLEPFILVKKIPELITDGKVLDLGAGNGRNSLYLASQGFEVTALDISQTALESLRKNAKQQGLKVKTKKADLADFRTRTDYSVIIATFVFQSIPKQISLKIIQRIQKRTKKGGINLLVVFGQNSLFYKRKRNNPNFFPRAKEDIARLYKSWEILNCDSKNIRIRPTSADGKPIFSEAFTLLARKP